MAKQYRITQQYVCLLVSKAKKKPRFLEELHVKEQESEALAERVRDSIHGQAAAGTVLRSVDQIQKMLKND